MKTIKVVAAVIRDGDKIFATQRGYGDLKGGWEFPGGKIEDSCINSEEGYKLSVISGHKWISNLSTNGGVCIPSDGNGLLIHNFTKGTGQSDVHRMTIQNGKLVYGDTEQTFSMGDSEWDSFAQENPEATWTAISDKSKIEELQ